MTVMKLLFVMGLIQAGLSVCSAVCPKGCTCDRDSANRKRIRCDNGGLIVDGTLTPQNIDADTQVLYISAPPNKPNRITGLRPALFQNLLLEELHILHSQLESIGDRTFYYLSGTLKVLNLAHNHLVDISENNFRNLSQLTHLHLDHNRIVHLHSATFNYQRNLRVLTLSNNRIDNLGTRFLLQENPTLEVVDLSSNPLGTSHFEGHEERIPALIFQDVPNLKRVNFANTSINFLPYTAVARYCRSLEDLDVSLNKFIEIQDGDFNSIKSLRRLSFAGNKLTAINVNALRGMKLDFLDLSSTKFPLQASYFTGAQINGLSIANNDLQDIDTLVFVSIAQDLTTLHIGGNPLMILRDRMFQFLPKLKTLSLANMGLSQLPLRLFDYPHKITSLNISNNRFQQLHESLLQSCKLEVLDISNNDLQSLPLQLAQPTLVELYAVQNLLKKIPDYFYEVFRSAGSRIKTFRVHGNPLECDWQIGGLADWTSSAQGRSIVCGRDASQRCPVCVSPPQLKGKSTDEIKVNVVAA